MEDLRSQMLDSSTTMLNLQGDHPFTLRRSFCIIEMVLVLILENFYISLEAQYNIHLFRCLFEGGLT